MKTTGVTCPQCQKSELNLRFTCRETFFYCSSCENHLLLADLFPILSDVDFEILACLVEERTCDRV